MSADAERPFVEILPARPDVTAAWLSTNFVVAERQPFRMLRQSSAHLLVTDRPRRAVNTRYAEQEQAKCYADRHAGR